MAAALTTATPIGVLPSMMAGTAKARSTTKLAPRPAKAVKPRRRPRITTASANTAANQKSTGFRWRSANWYWKPLGADGV